mgnify:CR=1 FL=1
MKLFCNATSPFARKVRVAMHEMGLSDRVEEVLTDPFAASPPPELLAANPLGRFIDANPTVKMLALAFILIGLQLRGILARLAGTNGFI